MNVRLPALLAAALALAPALAAAAPPAAQGDAAVEAALERLKPEEVGPPQRKLLVEYARADFVYCGRPATVAAALAAGGCRHAERQLRLAAGMAPRSSATAQAVQEFVGRYYASFDRRAKIDLKEFGPPLGDEKAPVALVEYSDFTCPYCQGFRPALEAFVASHPGRVKLYFKPFPIESHPGAVEAALAAEWARGQGAFWAAHDALFQVPSHDLDSLAGAADALKLDAADLRDAVTSRRQLPKIRASQNEGRTLGVRGTPTLFMNGRLLELPDHGPTWLEFALEDEEEWLRNGGRWEKD